MAVGDIEIAAMVGAMAAACTAQAVVIGCLISAAIAVVIWIVRGSGKVFMPLGPGLCLAGLATLFWC